MLHTQTGQLIKMANQIGDFFQAQASEPEVAAQSVASHLKLFWAPTMRAQLMEQFDKGEAEGLKPVVEAALTNHRANLLVNGEHVRGDQQFVFPEGGGDAG